MPNNKVVPVLTCLKCIIISSPVVSLEQLLSIETKYLRLFLTNRKVPIGTYHEKSELAQLILAFNSNSLRLNTNRRQSLSNNNYSQSVATSNSPTISNTSETSQYNNNNNNNSNNDNNIAISETRRAKRASLSDLSNIDDIYNLNIKQIKEILASNFVNYKGCFEKQELIDRLKLLYISNAENKNIENTINQATNSKPKEEEKDKNSDDNNNQLAIGHTDIQSHNDEKDEAKLNKTDMDLIKSTKKQYDESDICKICMDRLIDCVLIECGHMCACVKCGKLLNECPICRQYVVRALRVFKP